ncbi:MAG: YgfZ/GcvT domain-containing protein [Candidatus Eiseniibacteriota bacterium]
MSTPVARTTAEEYRATQTGAAAVDLSGWTVLHLRGSDTRTFLQGLATQEFEGALDGSALPTLFLNEKGRPVALAWVAVADDGASAWVIADDGARATLRPHFERFRVMEDVEFEGPDPKPELFGVVGPERAILLRELSASTTATAILASDPISFLLAPAFDRARHGAALLTRDSFEAWRLATGIPRTGVDIDLDRIATELSLPGAISATKGCYVGQEVVSRTSNRGQVRRRRVGFRFAWSGSPIPARAEIRAADSVVGYVTSSAREPGTNEGLGMGYLSTESPPDGVKLSAGMGSGEVRVSVRDWPL